MRLSQHPVFLLFAPNLAAARRPPLVSPVCHSLRSTLHVEANVKSASIQFSYKLRRCKFLLQLGLTLLLIELSVIPLFLLLRPFQAFDYNANHVMFLCLFWWFPCVALHELGHVLAGKLTNFKVLGMAVGPFKLDWSGKKFHAVFSGVWAFSGFTTLYTLKEDDLTARMRLMFLGGPLMNLSVAAATYGFLYMKKEALSLFTFELIYSLCAISLLQGFFNLIPTSLPSPGKIAMSDGAIIAQLSGRTRDVKSAEIASRLAVQAGLIAADLPEVWRSKLSDHSSFFAHYLMYLYHLEKEEPQRAKRHLLELTALQADQRGYYKALAELENGYFEAVYEQNTARAEAAVLAVSESRSGGQFRNGLIELVEAGIIHRRQPQEALQKVEQGLINAEKFWRKVRPRRQVTETYRLHRLRESLLGDLR